MGHIPQNQAIEAKTQPGTLIEVLPDGLIESAAGGDTMAFRRLVELHQQYVFAIAFGLLRSDDAAAEVAQDAFVRVWNNLSSYDGRAKFTTWLYKIVVNLCYDRMKTERRKVSMLSALRDHLDTSGPPADDPLTRLLRSDLCRRVLEIAASLPPKQRLVFHLRDVNDCPMEEIAGIAGMTMGTVKANLSYARKKIREELERDDTHGKTNS